MSNVLVIGEKSSQVKTFTQVLFSGGKAEKKTKYLYLRRGKWNGNDLTFLPLAGHISRIDTKKEFNWGKCEPIEIVRNPKALYIKEDRTFRKYIREEAENADELWLATDPDSEGDNIAMEAYDIAVRANPDLKDNTRRIWNSSLTRAEILRSFNNIRDWDNSLALGVQGRRFIDAWVGFAGTREITRAARSVGALQGKNIFSVGRVQLPTLYLIVLRDREIDGFIPQTLYNLNMDIMSDGMKVLTLKHINSPFSSPKQLAPILRRLKDVKNGIIDSFTVRSVNSRPPKPLNTTDALAMLSSQMRVNAKQGLKLMADLYEQGFLSYPRTDNRRFKDGFPHKDVLDKLECDECFTSWIEEIQISEEECIQVRVNGKKEGVEDHDPIHPTGEIPSITEKITARHITAWNFFARYYIGMFMSDLIQEKGTVRLKVENDLFEQKYQLITDRGWTNAIHWKVPKDSAQFSFEEGQTVDIDNLKRESYKTKPPRRWSDASIIKALEKDRIGTKSSRPDVLKKLVDRGYIIRTRNAYNSTDEGKQLIAMLEKTWPDLVTSQFTRNIENYMDQVATKKKKYIDIIKTIRAEYLTLHKKLIKQLPEFKESLKKSNNNIIPCDTGDCDGVMIKRINKKTEQAFLGCSRYPACKNTRSMK